MTVTAFLIILASCAAITSLFTEGVKKFLDEQKITYVSNILVLVIAVAVGCGAAVLYYINYQVPLTALNSVYLALMGVANWLGATLGYDKVRQTIAQIGAKEEEG